MTDNESMSNMEPSLVRAKLVLQAVASDTQQVLLKNAAAALGDYCGAPFEGLDLRSKDFLAGLQPSTALVVRLTHRAIAAKSDPESNWLKLTVAQDSREGATFVFLTINTGRLPDQSSTQWALGTLLLPRLVEELGPSLAFMNWDTLESHGPAALPEATEHSGDGFPRVITPWFFVRNGRLSAEAEEALLGLPFARVTPIIGGSVFETILNVRNSPDPALKPGIEQLIGHSVHYRKPPFRGPK